MFKKKKKKERKKERRQQQKSVKLEDIQNWQTLASIIKKIRGKTQVNKIRNEINKMTWMKMKSTKSENSEIK